MVEHERLVALTKLGSVKFQAVMMQLYYQHNCDYTYNGALFTVDLIVTVIKAVRKPERFHPLTQIVPSLRQYFRYLYNFADINLQVYSETFRSCDWQDATSIT